MAYIVKIPKLGLTMTEATINTSLEEGDLVKKEDVVFEIATDKLTNEIEAEEDGVVRKLFANVGDTRPVLDPIAIIATENEDISQLLQEVNTTLNIESENEIKEEDIKVVEDIVSETKKQNSLGLASPYAKHLAKEKNIDLSNVVGSGPRQMIVAKDLDKIEVVEDKKASKLAQRMMDDLDIDINDVKSEGKVKKKDVETYISSIHTQDKDSTIEKASHMRKIISKNMKESYLYSPRVTYNLEIDTTQMQNLRSILKESFMSKDVKLTYNSILIKVCAKALLEYPYMNSSFDEEEITIYNSANVGLAVEGKNGLVVPNVKKAQIKDLFEISKNVQEMIERAKTAKFNSDDLVEGTFTITNLGNYGLTSFTPIINQPEVAILGVNAIEDKPVVIDGEIVIKPMMGLSLVADHRLIDGVYAAKFLNRVKELLENPFLLI